MPSFHHALGTSMKLLPSSTPSLLVVTALASLLVSTQTLAQGAAPFGASDPRGRWITANGNLEVEIAPCGAALCGTVTKVLGNRSMSLSGEAMTPADPRPALGMTLLTGLLPEALAEGGPRWTGEIYNRENAKTYRCRMSVRTGPAKANELVLHAYIGIPLIGKTQQWQRAPE